MNSQHQDTDHDILLRLDESVNGEVTGLKALVQKVDQKLDEHFGNHKRERNAIIVALSSALIAIVLGLYHFL